MERLFNMLLMFAKAIDNLVPDFVKKPWTNSSNCQRGTGFVTGRLIIIIISAACAGTAATKAAEAGSGLLVMEMESELVETGFSADTLTLTVMATTDVHGRVRAWDYYRNRKEPDYGLSKVATLVDSIRSERDNHLLLDAGDWMQGNPFAEYFARHDEQQRHYPFLSVVDHMNFDAVVLGNHEFNFGLEYLDRQIAMTETPVIGANIYRHATDEPAYTPYIMREFEGIKVAVVGLTTPGSAVWDRRHVEGVLDFGDGLEGAKRFVTQVREEGADVVIILAHTGLDGGTSYEREDLGDENFGRVAGEQVPGVDLLVLGHTHRAVEDVVLEGAGGQPVGVIQPGRWAEYLGVADLKIMRKADGSIKVIGHDTRNYPVSGVPEHPEIVEMTREEHHEVVEFVVEPITHTGDEWSTGFARLQDTPVIDLIQHVQKEETGAQISAAAAFNTSVSFGPGPVTRGDIALLYPYYNTLYKLEVTGEQIRQFLEHTSQYYLTGTDEKGMPQINREWPGFNFDMLAGVEYALDLRRPPGERVTRLKYKGEAVEDEDRFTMAVNSYRAEGGGGFDMLADAEVICTIDRSVSDLILEFLQDTEEIRHEDVYEENWHLIY